MAKALTAKAVENKKPSDVRQEIPDGGCRGLYLVLQPSGKRSWAVRYRFGGKSKKLTLDGPSLSLADARRRATAALHQLEHGFDPAAAKFEARTLAAHADAERKRNTVEQLAVRFLDQHVRKKLRPASQRQLEHIFDDIVLPAWHGRVVADVVRRDVRDLVEGIAIDRPVTANRTLAALTNFFGWLCEHDVIAASPCAGVKRPGQETARSRVLDTSEIAALWKACEQVGGYGGACVQVMLLTGQRRGEVAGMRRSELEGDLWRIPAARMKAKTEHLLPLPVRVLAIIEAQPVIGDSDFVFTATGRRPFNDFSWFKRHLDKHMQPKGPWTYHDIRRTVASQMAGLDVPVEAVERLLAHKSGSFAGVVAVYQRHSFVPQMRAALERWSERVNELVHGTLPAKVISLDRRR
jgi:integrase